MFTNTILTKKWFNSLLTLLMSFVFFFTPALHAQQSNTPRVDSFTLVNADTGEDIAVYANVSGASTGSVPIGSASRISLRFNTSNTRSVRISGISAQPRVENQQPYSLLGDDGTIDGGTIYKPWSPSVGLHSITVAPFAGSSTSGEQGASATLRFTVTDNDDTDIVPSIPAPAANRILPATMLLLGHATVDVSTQREVVVFIGSSIVQHAFGRDLTKTHDVMMEKLEANGVDNIDFYGYGFSGQTVGGILPAVDDALIAFPEAKIALMIGGNDVTRTRPYATRTPEEVAKFTLDIETLIARFDGIEDQLILVPLTYSAYAFPGNDDSMFLDGSSGVEPYNVNEYLPRVPNSQKNIDGNHILDLFNFTRNNRFAYSGSDGIHYNRFGIEGKRQFVADRIGYLINGGERPEVVGRD